MRSCKGYAFVPVEERVIIHQRFHESCSFFGYGFVIARLRAEYGGFEQTAVSNSFNPTVFVDLPLIPGLNGDRPETEPIRPIAGGTLLNLPELHALVLRLQDTATVPRGSSLYRRNSTCS